MADSQYVIQIASELTGAETLAELDELTDKLQGAGRKSDDFQRAIKRLTSDLDAAKLASSEAAAALAAGNDQYKILERDAIRAGKAVEKAQAAGRFDPRAARAAHDAQAALAAYSSTLQGLQGRAAAATANQDRLARALANVNKIGAHADARAQGLNMRYEKLQAAVGRLPGPLGSIGSQLVGNAKAAHGLTMAFGGAQTASLALAAGAALAVAAVVALTVALVAGAVAATAYAVKQADAARSARLSREAFAALSDETAAGVSAFSAVSAETGLADAELVALTKSLRSAGVSAADMPKALRAAATAEAALGQGGSSEFIERVKSGEIAVDDFARTVDAKFGGVVAEKLRGLDAQGKRLSKLWNALFAGVNVEPFLDAVGVIVGMFEKANPLAEALGLALRGTFNPVGPLALQAAYAVEAFALDVAIFMTKAYLSVRDNIELIKASLGVLRIGFNIVTGDFAEAFDLSRQLAGKPEQISALGGMLGSNLVQGVIAGVTGSVPGLLASVGAAMSSATATAKEVLGIASPSRVFAEIGTDTVDGYTGAIEDGASEVQGSMAALVAAEPDAAQAASSASAPAAAPAAPGRSTTISGNTFILQGVKDAEEAEKRIEDLFTRMLTGDADSLGGAEARA